MIPINQYFKTGTGEDLVIGRIADAEERAKARFRAMQLQLDSIHVDPAIVAAVEALKKAFTDAGTVADQRMSLVTSDQSHLSDRIASAESSIEALAAAVNRTSSTISSAGRQIEQLTESHKIDSEQILNRFLAVTDMSQRLEGLERGAEDFRHELTAAIERISTNIALANRGVQDLSESQRVAAVQILDRFGVTATGLSNRMDAFQRTIEALEQRLENAERRTWWSMLVDWLRHLWRRR